MRMAKAVVEDISSRYLSVSPLDSDPSTRWPMRSVLPEIVPEVLPEDMRFCAKVGVARRHTPTMRTAAPKSVCPSERHGPHECPVPILIATPCSIRDERPLPARLLAKPCPAGSHLH